MKILIVSLMTSVCLLFSSMVLADRVVVRDGPGGVGGVGVRGAPGVGVNGVGVGAPGVGVVPGAPVAVDERGGVYVPRTAIPVNADPVNPYYLTVGDTQRVCYHDENPSLANLNPAVVKVRLAEGDVPLHCYDYNP